MTIGAVLFAAVVAVSSTLPILPNHALTPGAIRTTDAHSVCTTRTSTIRNVPESEKRAVFKEYGIIDVPHAFEVDHLVSLELGGSNDIQNLWPQSYKTQPWNAHVKDRLENRLHKLVCDGSMTLQAAQRGIETNWITLYEHVFGGTP